MAVEVFHDDEEMRHAPSHATVPHSLCTIVVSPRNARTVSRIIELPAEVLLSVLLFCDKFSCGSLQEASRAFRAAFLTYCVDHFYFAHTPCVHDWVMRECGDDAFQRECLCRPPAISPVAKRPSAALHSPPESDTATRGTSIVETSFHQVLPSCATSGSPLPSSADGKVSFRNMWRKELSEFYNVRHNIRRALFDYTVLERVSHAHPLVLPNGWVLFTKWQQIIVFARTRGKNKDGTFHNEHNQWIRAGSASVHTDTISSMKFDHRSGTVLSSGLDGTVRRWAVRRESPVDLDQPLIECIATYEMNPPVPLFVFTFDVYDLDEPDDLNEDSALLVYGTETGMVALHHINRTRCTYLGGFHSNERRIRAVKFLNSSLFTEPAKADGTQSTVVDWVTLSVFTVRIIRHHIVRRKVEQLDGDDKSCTGYEYSSPDLQAVELVVVGVFGENPCGIDVPLQYHAAQGDRNGPISDVPIIEFSPLYPPPPPSPTPATAAPAGRKAYRRITAYGNQYFSFPCIMLFNEDSRCSLLTLRQPPPLRDDEPLYHQTVIAQAPGVTCGVFSPFNALIALGSVLGEGPPPRSRVPYAAVAAAGPVAGPRGPPSGPSAGTYSPKGVSQRHHDERLLLDRTTGSNARCGC